MKSFFNAIKWEIVLSLKEYAHNKIGLLMDFLVFTWTYIAVYYYNVSDAFAYFYGVDDVKAKVLVIIGYVFWQNSSAALGYCKGNVSNEIATGLFEVRLQSKFPMEFMWFGRLVVSCIVHIITYVGILVFGIFVVGFGLKDIEVIIYSILMSFVPLIGMYGIGMVFGSFSVIEKDIGSFLIIFQTILLFLSNALSPTRGGWVYMIPFSLGVEIMRNIYMGHSNPIMKIILYVFVNIIWFMLGCICYRIAIRFEKKVGSFDRH